MSAHWQKILMWYYRTVVQRIEKLTSGLQGVQSALDKTGETADQMGLIQAMGAVNTGLGQLDTGINGEKGLKAGVKAYTDGVSQLMLFFTW